jgi:hypothetical protein
MRIPINSFEQYIDETILKRGFQYFKKGHVHEPEELMKDEYEAIVDGTEPKPYTVNLTIKNDVVTQFVCTCPYDIGPVCKHVAAVLFYLQQNELDLDAKPLRKKTGHAKTSRKKTVTQQVDEILSKLSHENLKEYLKALCINDTNFRQQFLAEYASLVMPDSKALYAGQIKTILDTTFRRYGYIGYSETRYVSSAVNDLLERADKSVETKNYRTAIFIACAVLEELTQALDFVDDSNGDIGGCIDAAINVLLKISQQPIDDKLRRELYIYCIKSWQESIFKGWDWHFTMLDIATELTDNEIDAKQIHVLLDEIKPNNTGWDLIMQESQRIRVNLIRKIEGEEKASEFLEKNLSNSDFRKEIIERAIIEKDYKKAIILCEEGITIDDKEKPGLANTWRDFLVMIYINLNDTDRINRIARYLFLESNREKKQYFDILKKQISSEKWEEFVGYLIKDISKKNKWIDYRSIAQIYIWEERWDKLLEIVRNDCSLHTLDAYEKYLLHDYANELTDLYRTAILKEMQRANDRGQYQMICRYLRRMVKMGARETVNSIIRQLEATYPKRKALLEELQEI